MTGFSDNCYHSTRRPISDFAPKAGSIMLAIVVALLIMAALASVIIPLVSSSGQQGVSTNLASKAYLLAESGFRYVTSQYRHGGTNQSERNDVLEALDGNYTLDNDRGRFDLTLNAFFYEITADANGTDTIITTRCPGTFPFDEVDLNNSLHLSIDNTLYNILGFTKSGNNEDGNVTFTINPLGTSIAAGSIALPAVASAAASQTLANGGNLAYESGGGGMFPLENGRILVGYRSLTYRYNDRDNNMFMDVRDTADPLMDSYPVPDNTPITLDLYARLHSTGIAGSGGLETRREIVYYDILPQDTESVRREFRDSFEDQASTGANWTSDTGSHEVGTVDGGSNQALKVIEAPEGGSLITLKATTLQDLFNATRRSTGGYLSYDVQTKVGYYANATSSPAQGFFPFSPIPAHVAAGLSFRLSPSGSSYNGYGLSFMRAGSMEDPPLSIAPIQDKRLIILWQQTNSGQDYQWLAYKDISEKGFWETGFEEGWNEMEWAYSAPPWQRTTDRPYPGGNYSFSYSKQDANPYYLTFQGESGEGIALPAERTSLRFQSWYYAEHPMWNLKQVQVRIVGNADWDILEDNLPDQDTLAEWRRFEYPLSDYTGKTVQFRFLFQPPPWDTWSNATWYIDNVEIVEDAWPIMDATLVVRLKEAALLAFSNGSSTPIAQNDRVYGRTSGTLGTVIVPPVLSGGGWSSGDAQGVLLLNKVTSTTAFSAGEDLMVIDSNATARVETFSRKENVIKVYYADPSGLGTADDTPLDAYASGYPLLGTGESLQWPVAEGGNWTAAQDYFRLIHWDAVNDANVTDLSVISSPDEPGTILRHQDPDLQSPGMDTTLNQPELGLHSFGDGAANVYFDDFGVQIYIRQDSTFPLQQ